jgi:hypothetical protein
VPPKINSFVDKINFIKDFTKNLSHVFEEFAFSIYLCLDKLQMSLSENDLDVLELASLKTTSRSKIML